MLAYVSYGSTKVLVNLLYKVYRPDHRGDFIAKVVKSSMCGYEKGAIVTVGGFNTLNNIRTLKGDMKKVQWVNLQYNGVPSIQDYINSLQEMEEEMRDFSS